MRILFTTQPGSGHWRPLAPLALALQERGHEVAVATLPAHCRWIEAAGFRCFPMGEDDDDSMPDPRPERTRQQDAPEQALAWLGDHRELLLKLARLESVELLASGAATPPAAAALVGEAKLLVPMAGMIDAPAEIARLERQRGKLESDLGKTRAKLDRPSFVENAPAEVVDKERRRAEELKGALSSLDEQLERIRALA